MAELVKRQHFVPRKISEEHWAFYKQKMEEKIKKDWANRFRSMMKENNWTYEDVAKLGNFKNGKVIEATVSRGLPSFAKLAVIIHENSKNKNYNKVA